VSPWIYGLIAAIVTAALGWLKYKNLASLLREIGEAVRVTGEFVEEFATLYEDGKLSPEETEKLGAKASALWKEWKDVIGIFKD